MKIGVITKNPGKIKIAEYVFPKYGVEFEFINLEFPEIQAATSEEIAEYTAKQAAKELNMPVVREDASLYIRALGFPGPFTAYLERMIPAEKLLKILEPFVDGAPRLKPWYHKNPPSLKLRRVSATNSGRHPPKHTLLRIHPRQTPWFSAKADRSGYFECAVSLREPNKNPVTFVERFEIEINNKETGDLVPPKAWDRILRFKGETRTFAEYPIEERIHIWAKPYEELAKTIKRLTL